MPIGGSATNPSERPESAGLHRLAGGADEIAQNGDVGAVGADAAGVHGEAEALGEFEVDTSIIEFGKAETRGGLHAVETRRVDRAWRAMTLPGTARQLVELLPVAFVPRIHRMLRPSALRWMRTRSGKFAPPANGFEPSACAQDRARTVLLIYPKRTGAKEKLRLVYQTRHPA